MCVDVLKHDVLKHHQHFGNLMWKTYNKNGQNKENAEEHILEHITAGTRVQQ